MSVLPGRRGEVGAPNSKQAGPAQKFPGRRHFLQRTEARKFRHRGEDGGEGTRGKWFGTSTGVEGSHQP